MKVNGPHREAAVVRHGLHAGGRRRPRPAACSTARRRARRSSRRSRRSHRGGPVTLPMRVDQPRVTAHEARRRRSPGADGGLGAGRADARADPLPDPAVADRHPAQAAEERRDEAADRRARSGRVLQGASRRGSTRPRTTRSSSSPERHQGAALQGRPRARRARRPPRRCWPPRSARPTARRRSWSPRSRPKRTTQDATGDGHHRPVLELHDVLRRRAEPDPQRPGGLAPRRQHADRARQGVLVQRHDRRAERGQGPARGAGDHQRRARERPRRRHLPGLDDGLQRGVRGRPADHGADEPRALHQPLPAGPRRDRQLPGHRPQVRQRHGPLAAAAHVRQLELADREPVRDAAAPQGRQRDVAARHDGAGSGEDRRRTRTCSSARRWSTNRARRRCRRASTGRSTTTNGKLLYDNTWYSSYVGDKSIIREGTKPKPKPKPKPSRRWMPTSLAERLWLSPVDGSSTPTTTTPTRRPASLGGGDRLEPARRGSASAAASRGRRRRVASNRPRRPRRRASARTRTGSGRRAGRRSAR